MKNIKSSLAARFPVLKNLWPLIREFNPLTSEEIGKIEEHLGTELPETYKTFLLEIGGGGLPGFPKIQESHGESQPTIDRFFGAECEKDYWLLQNISDWNYHHPDLSQNVIPIGEDVLGNPTCLGIKGEERGKVYFYDGNEPYLVADSFEDFLNRLELNEE